MDSKSAVSSGSGWSLRRRLFSYMLILVCLLIVVLIAVLIIGDQFSSVSTHTYDLLDMQMKIFERDIDGYFDTIAAKGIALSKEVSALLDEYLTAGGMEFADLADNPEGIAALQELLIGRLLMQLEHCDCSGVYVMFDTTVNSSIENSESSRTGLYLQTNG
nr:hypothetical protein [Clostridia bacterium]